MNTETFILGDKEFTCVQMNVFAANKLIQRILKVVLPLLGSVAGSKNVLDMDIKDAAILLSEQLDEKLMETIVLPLLSDARVYSVTDKKFVKDSISIDQVFTIETLFNFYELVWSVGRYQFAPFFGQIMNRFGVALGVESPKEISENLPTV